MSTTNCTVKIWVGDISQKRAGEAFGVEMSSDLLPQQFRLTVDHDWFLNLPGDVKERIVNNLVESCVRQLEIEVRNAIELQVWSMFP